ncbi:hypothetical protein HYX09_05945 [Candidatus Woesearchaeota archaeon]|nr:hypothetical protein [Candidatus Woesearchaeota archaeon]
MSKKGIIFTLDAILAIIIGALIISASYFLLSRHDPGFNMNALSMMSFDSLAVLEKDSTFRNAADAKNPSGLAAFITSMPGNTCANISVFDNSSMLITSSQKSGCSLNYSIVSRRAFVSSNFSSYYAEMKISFG